MVATIKQEEITNQEDYKVETVVFDIEASCDDTNINPYYNMETIEIGAVKVKGGVITDEFQTFVKPEYVASLTPFCTELTGITYDDLKDAPSFNEAIVQFYSFIYGLPIYSCGEFDKKFLVRELKEKGTNYSHKMAENAILSSHINLKKHFSAITGKGMCGMMSMAKILNIEVTGTHHRGLDDARNLAKIYIKLEEIRENEINKVFNGDSLVNLIENINKHHNQQYEIIGDSIKAGNDNISTLEFVDKWRNVILIDHKLKYLSKDEAKTLERYAKR